MLESQRLAARAVCQVLEGRSLTETLETLFRSRSALTSQQRSTAQDLAYGTLRHYGTLQAVLDQLLAHPLSDRRVGCLLLAALYQLVYRGSAPHAVVSEAVEAATALSRRAPRALVNAVLRNFLRRREELLARARESDVGRWSHPGWWIERLRAQYPGDYRAILEAGNLHPPMALRVNRRRLHPDAYLERLRATGLEGERAGASGILLGKPVPVKQLPGFAQGEVSVQDLGSQEAVPLLDLRDGQRVLDACAAPGGKTAHILECADVDCLALDNDAARLERVRHNLERLGLSARLAAADAADPAQWWDGRPFDRILADVPCSASGVVRRHPDIKWLRRERDIAQYAAAQARILDALWPALAAGGKLLYATCSLFREENGEQVTGFLARHPDARALPLAGALAPDGQLLPDPRHDGFFYALLAKRPH
jgi:16S rRNA (cytosine967-C5)-methyltransferase